MAGRTRTTKNVETETVPESPEQDAADTGAQDGFAFDVRETDAVIKYDRPEKPNPLLPAFERSLNDGKTLEIPVTNAEHAKAAVNLLRRAAKTRDVGLSVRHYPELNVVRFRAKAEKIKRAYTAEEIRTWARANGADESLLKPRIDKRVRVAFKDAHNGAGDSEE